MYEEQIMYVLEQFEAGHTREEIAAALRDAGYDSATITTILDEADARRSGAHMTPPPAAGTLLSYDHLINGAFSFPLRHSLPFVMAFLGIVAVFAVFGAGLLLLVGPLFLAGLGLGAPSVGILGVVLLVCGYLLLIMCSSFVSAALMRALLLRHERVGFWSSFWWFIKRLVPASVVLLLVQLSVSGGILLFVVPGIALALYTSFAFQLFIVEDRRGIDALLRSIDIVYNRWWSIFGRIAAVTVLALIVLMVLALLAGMLNGLSSGFAQVWPLVLVIVFPLLFMYCIAVVLSASVLLFESAVSSRPATAYDPTRYESVRVGLYVVAGLGVLVTAFQIMGMVRDVQLLLRLDSFMYMENGAPGMQGSAEGEIEQILNELDLGE